MALSTSHITCIGCGATFTRQTRYVGNYCASCRIVSADLETESNTKTDTQTDTDE
jgi:hypothetical protein